MHSGYPYALSFEACPDRTCAEHPKRVQTVSLEANQQAGQSPRLSDEEFVTALTDSQRRLHAFVLSLLPYRSDAEDVLQETSIALWRKRDEFDPERDFLKWAFGVAYIQVLRHKKSFAKNRVFFSDELMATVAGELEQQADETGAREQALAQCLAKLKSQDLELIKHRYTKGVTALQTAVDLGRPINTVYKGLARIRRALHECINRQLNESYAS